MQNHIDYLIKIVTKALLDSTLIITSMCAYVNRFSDEENNKHYGWSEGPQR